jgi:phosphotransferase system HPr (HPr) family protein
MEIIEKLKIINPLGLNLRASAELVKTTSRFKCRILIENQHVKADAKSLLNLMDLRAVYGSEIKVTFEGEDAWEAQKTIRALFLGELAVAV